MIVLKMGKLNVTQIICGFKFLSSVAIMQTVGKMTMNPILQFG